MEGFKQIGVICGEVSKPHYIWGYDSNNQKVLKKVPTIPDPVYPDMVGMGATDVLVIRETIEEVMSEFERLGFIMPEEDVWDFPEKPLRVKLSDTDVTDLLVEYSDFIPFIESMKDNTIKRNSYRFIYITELYPEHEAILKLYASYSLEYRP